MQIQPLADAFVTVCESPDAATIYTCSPGLTRCPSGRLVATMGLRGPGVAALPGPHYVRSAKACWQGKVFTSDDRGATWTHRADYPFLHARPFVAGASLYVLGHASDLMIVRSDDEGHTWSTPVRLTHGQSWHQAPTNVHYANGCVYLVMERRVRSAVRGWPVSELAPVLMRARVDDDLTRPESWAFADELPFCGAVNDRELDMFGVPFFDVFYAGRAVSLAPGRECVPIGWLETNVVQFTDPDHYWHDPAGRTFHLWSRGHTGGTGYACIAKVVERDDGSMQTMLERAPSGKTMLFVPCPGGQMKFHVLYDHVTKLYWLLSTQATDSMTRAERLDDERYNLPNNERQRLVLHFSRNMIDWCFAGLICAGPTQKQSRSYASMVTDGDDLCILSRSGDHRAASAHDGNLVTFHKIPEFRKLVY